MAKFSVARLSRGPGAGRIRFSVEFTLHEEDELCAAAEFGVLEEIKSVLSKPARERGLGPVAAKLANVMHDAVVEVVVRGSKEKQP